MKIWVYITLAVGLVAQIYYFSNLPETVANHFGGGGMPNGWMSNKANLLVSSTAIIINSLLFLSISHILKKVPLRYISFPKREYWLAPERRDKSIELMSNWFFFIGLMTNIFLIATFHMVYMANLITPPKLNEGLFINSLIIYFIIVIIWLILLFKRFNKIN